jgi:hypothetical protein
MSYSVWVVVVADPSLRHGHDHIHDLFPLHQPSVSNKGTSFLETFQYL